MGFNDSCVSVRGVRGMEEETRGSLMGSSKRKRKWESAMTNNNYLFISVHFTYAAQSVKINITDTFFDCDWS